MNITIGVFGADEVAAGFFSAAFSTGLGVSFGACAGAAAGVGVGVGLAASGFFSSFGASWAGLVVAAAAETSSSNSIKSAPTSIFSFSWANNLLITPALSDFIST